jgi:hypothetical protein
MIGLPKLVLLILVIVAAWYGYRWLNAPARELPRQRARAPHPAVQAQDLVPCEICGAYVAATAPGCGRPDCPRPR